MKKFLQFFTGAFLAAFAFAVLSLFTVQPDVQAQINRFDSAPIRWGGITNNFGVNASGTPVVTINTTNYTGLTTNISNGTNRFYFANGVLVTVGAN